jgi:hypothetical protein
VARDDVLAFAWLGLATEGALEQAAREGAAQAQADLRSRMSYADIAAGTAKMDELRAGRAAAP